MKPTPSLRRFLLASTFLVVAITANAQKTWEGSVDNLWTTAGNWSPSGAPGAGADVIFDGTGANLNTTLNAPFTLNKITFTADQADAVTINTTHTANRITFNPGNVLSVAAGDHKIAGTGDGSSATARDLVFTGTGTSTYSLNIASGASFEIAGRIGAGGANQNTRNYTLAGGGTLIFSANNGGSGAWQLGNFLINEGLLRLAATNAAGHSGNKFTVASGAALELEGPSFGSGNGAQTISGTGIGGTGAIRSLSGTNAFGTTSNTGSLTLAADSSIGVDADELSIGLAIGESGDSRALTKVGDGILVLGNANTYSGATTVSAGVVVLGNSLAHQNSALDTANSTAGDTTNGLRTSVTTLTFGGLTGGKNLANVFSTTDGGYSGVTALTLNTATGANHDYSGNIANGAAGMTLTKIGAGTQILSGNNTYTGATTISAGILQIGDGVSPTAGTLGNNSNTSVASGATLRISRMAGTGAQAYGYFGALSGSGTVEIIDGARMDFRANQAGSGNLAFDVDGRMGIRTGGTDNVTEVRLGELSGNGFLLRGGNAGGAATVFIGEKNTSSTFSGNIQSTELGVEKLGDGTLTLAGSNTYGGTTTISSGTLRLNGTHINGGAYTVGANGRLEGAGSTASAINVSGVLSTGASVESFASGALSMLAGSTFEYEVNSSAALAAAADLQVVTGDLALTGTVNLAFDDLASTPTAFDIDTVFSLINYSGSWNGGLFTYGGDEILNGGEFVAGLNTWRLDYNSFTAGSNFEDHQIAGSFVNITVIPEPSTALLGGLGALLLLRRRR